MYSVKKLLSRFLGSSPTRSGLDQERQLAFQAAQEVRTLKDRMRVKTPENCALHGFKVFSQFDEDGIIERIFSLIGEGSRTFIEIGCGNGLENNSHYLLLKGWRGNWLDGSPIFVEDIRRSLGGLSFARLEVTRAMVDMDNAAQWARMALARLNIARVDFLSLDIDGNDVHVLAEVVAGCNPRVICVEYNAKFPPPLAMCMPYHAKHTWTGDDYHGGSLQAFVDLLEGRYRLITCNLSGANAFFCNADEAGAFRPYDAASLYQPARYHLIPASSGHPPTLKWLADSLQGKAGRVEISSIAPSSLDK
jgi:hypothetical protein